MMERLTAGLMVLIMICLVFTSIQPVVSAFEKEVFSFNRIWYDETVGFNKGSQGNVILAVAYTNNNTLRTIDYCRVEFERDPFYLSIKFTDEIYIERDDEGNIIYQEPADGYLYLRRAVMEEFIPGDIKHFATRNLNYSTVNYSGERWYRIKVPDFNSLYEWKEFEHPVENEKWYTWGNSNSIKFSTRAMYVNLTKESIGSIELGFEHPNDNTGQNVSISKTYLSSKGITKPVFEWGDNTPWKMIGYEENSTHYFINPEHFSFIGIHEAVTGEASGFIVDRDMSVGDEMTLTGEHDGSSILSQTDYVDSYYFILIPNNYWTSMYQTFREEDIHAVTRARVLLTVGSSGEEVDILCSIRDSSNNILTQTLRTFTTPFEEEWEYFDFPDVYLEAGKTYKLYLQATDSGGWANAYWFAENGNPYKNGRSQWSASWDHAFELFGYNESVERIASENTERNILSVTLDKDYNVSQKNRTITINPEGDGYWTTVSYVHGYGVGEEHWDCVQEETANDNYNYVYTDVEHYEGDYFTTFNPFSGPGIIDNITVYARARESNSAGNAHMTIAYITGFNDIWWDGFFDLTTSWTTYLASVNETVLPMSFSTFDSFETGFEMYLSNGYSGYTAQCTRSWAEVEYHMTPGLVCLKIPVSDSVTSITEVLNQTSGIAAYEVDTFYELENNTFYFDAGNNFVYIGTTNLSSGQNVNWSVNCTYGSSFEVVPPNFLRSGDNFACRGVILNPDGEAIDGYISTTTIQSQNNTIVAQAMWNCSFGNYECDISTTQIVPGIYSWEIKFVDDETGLVFKKGGPLYLDVPIGGEGGNYGPYASAYLYYSFFDLNTGTGLDDNFFKFYISPDTVIDTGDRVKGGVKPTYLGQTLYFKICDFFDNRIYPENESYTSVYVEEAETYIDVGINLRQFLIKNMNQSTVYVIVRDDDTDQQIGRWIPPYEMAEFLLLNNTYNITVQYYNSATGAYIRTDNYPSFNIDVDTFLWIGGYDLADIIIAVWNTNSTIMDQIINIGVNINNDGSNVINQIINSNVRLNNLESNITTQITSVWMQINNTNTTIAEQANLIRQDIDNVNSNITNQINGILQNISNVNSTIINQANLVKQDISNLNTNITTQVNSIWQEINNTNTTIVSQLNTITQNINNVNSTIVTQANIIKQQIINFETNITTQLNIINQDINNTNSTIHTQLNSIVQQITNMNSTLQIQLNSVSQHITNFETNITTQVNSVWADINNSNSSIHYQLNVITADITNMNTSINTQINYVTSQIDNFESNITTQFNQIDISISNMETNITNQINFVNISITNTNTSLQTQLNTIYTTINNNHVSIVDQINLIWSEVNNTNSSIYSQITGVHTTISNFWTNVNYSFTVIQSDITNTNTTIQNLINASNATLYAKLIGILDNVSAGGVSVFQKVLQVLDNLSSINASVNGSTLLEILDLTQEIQQNLTANFSYIEDRILNVSEVVQNATDSILDAISTINITGYNNLMQVLQNILEQFDVPHNWYIPSINYTLNDTMPPVSTISATSAFGGGINVRWVCTDDIAVSYCSVYYRVDAGTWRVWKAATSPLGADSFTDEITLENGTVYWFRCLGVDVAGNVENESSTNVCNITYVVITALDESLLGSIGSLVREYTISSIHFWLIIILLVIILIVVAWRRRRVRQQIVTYEKRRKRQIWVEEEF